MDTYADRIGKFNDMIATTNEHIKAVQDAATKFKDVKDPVGLGLTVTGAAAGGASGIASSVAGIQHFKDFKQMYKGLSSKLQGKGRQLGGQATQNNNPNGGDAGNPDPVANQGANAADGNANPAPAQPNAQANAAQPQNNGAGGEDVDGGVQARINDLENVPFPTEEANEINNAIDSKVGDAIGQDGKAFLNAITRASGRGADPGLISGLPEGGLKVDTQKDFLSFKNKVANDAIQRANSGQTQASGYDAQGNPTGDLPGPQPKPLNAVPDNNANPVAPDNGVNLAPDANAPQVAQNAAGDAQRVAQGADQDANGIIAQGRAALANLRPAQVPGRAGQAVQGLRNAPQMGDINAQAANAGARVQQGAADAAQGRLAPGANPNGGNAALPANNNGAGANGGGDNINPGQGARPGAAAADAEGAAGGAEEGIEGTLGAVGAGLDEAAAFSGPAAPIIGLIGGLVSLGTTIAGLFHKKPPPVKVAPPPVATVSVGGNLKDTASGMGGGIF